MSTTEVPVAATGLLRTFAEAGMLQPIDFHLARRMGALAGGADELTELACALTVRELRLGSVCLDLTTAHELAPETALADGLTHDVPTTLDWPDPDQWLAAVTASQAVGVPDGPGKPFRLAGPRLYLDRFHAEERLVEEALRHRSTLPRMPVDDQALARATATFKLDDEQLAAVRMALTGATTVITGGPGTGKTTIAASIVAGLADPVREPLVALAAPTGKAALQLDASVREKLPHLAGHRLNSSTLHKLLAIAPGRERRTYGPGNPLPHDVIIVDETSMVSLTTMSWLLEAVSDQTRLVLIGDPDQLESVEAGAVLADMAASPDLLRTPDGTAVARLATNHRSQPEIAELAAAIRTGDAETALGLLAAGGACTLTPYTGAEPIWAMPQLAEALLSTATAVRSAALAGDGQLANRELARHRVLCAHREGPFGVGGWAAAARDWLAERIPGYAVGPGAWAGQPLLVTRSSDTVSNGDTGVVVQRGDRLMACIDRPSGPLWRDPASLDDVADLHAMTIHKSQGSQFQTVSVILPPVGSPLLTRQLLYTAVTRAERGVRIYGTPESLAEAVNTPARRASGLGLR